MKLSVFAVAAVLSLGVGSAAAAGLETIDRSIRKEPVYQSKQPKYCLLVFGPRADTRVWLALDLPYDPLREKPGDKEALHADRNGNGELIDPGERIPATVVTTKHVDHFSRKEYEQHLPRFHVGDVKSRDGKTTYAKLVVDVGWYIFGRRDREVTLAVDVPGRGRQTVGGQQLWFADTPAKAPVIWFDGALTLQLAPSGLLHCPVDYSGKEPPPPWYEEFPLVRGQRCQLRAQIGSAGVGLGTFNPITANLPPENLHPVATIELLRSDSQKPPIRLTVELSQRCCETIFAGTFDLPGDAAIGRAKVTLSFPGWREAKVEPAAVEVSVVEKDTRPAIFREPK